MMRSLTLFVFSLAMLTASAFLAFANSAEITVETDILYQQTPDIEQKYAQLDLYYDQNASQPKKLMVFAHGGSWVGGDKKMIDKDKTLIQWFINKGYVIAVPNFRLARVRGPHRVSYSDMAQDIAKAVSWLVNNRSQYGVTDDKILLVGFSSGAHLVALLSADERYLQGEGLSLDQIKGSISLDVHAYDVPYALQLMKNSDIDRNMAPIRRLFGESEQEQLQGSPIHYIQDATVPPTLLISADSSAEKTNKGFIAKMTGENYQKELQKAGHYAESHHFENETHNSLVLDFGAQNDQPTKAVGNFLLRLK